MLSETIRETWCDDCHSPNTARVELLLRPRPRSRRRSCSHSLRPACWRARTRARCSPVSASARDDARVGPHERRHRGGDGDARPVLSSVVGTAAQGAARRGSRRASSRWAPARNSLERRARRASRGRPGRRPRCARRSARACSRLPRATAGRAVRHVAVGKADAQDPRREPTFGQRLPDRAAEAAHQGALFDGHDEVVFGGELGEQPRRPAAWRSGRRRPSRRGRESPAGRRRASAFCTPEP